MISNVSSVHDSKLQHLREVFDKPVSNLCDSVSNISGCSLPNFVCELLQFGPKHPVLTKFNKMEFFKDIEKILPYANDPSCKSRLAWGAIQYSNSGANRKWNTILQRVRKFLIDNSLVAIPYDKGIGYCVMTKEQYNSKAEEILQGSQFKLYIPHGSQKQDNVIAVEDKFNRQLRSCIKVVDNKFIGPLPIDTVRWSAFCCLRASGSRIAPFHGLAKIHKQDIPLRPIISFPGSAYHNLATHLASLVSQLPQSRIDCDPNKIRDVLNRIPGNKCLVSYDVESLFTNVPVTESINLTVDLLYEHFGESLGYSRPTLHKLLSLCSKDCVLRFGQKCFVQTDGVAMGSPLGPLLANIFMAKLDDQVISSSIAPKYYTRYVDDTLCVVQDVEHADRLLGYMNNLSPSIYFSLELMNESSCLSFLDIEFQVDHAKPTVSTRVYRKPTTTFVTLNFNSVAPKRFKRAALVSLLHRAYTHSSTWQSFHEEIENIQNMFKMNGYPSKFIEGVIRGFLDRVHYDTNNETSCVTNKFSISLPLQYRGMHTQRFKWLVEKCIPGIRVYYRTVKLGQCLAPLNTPVPAHLRSHVVYRYTCTVCNCEYIGETHRHLITRINEHKKGELFIHHSACSNMVNFSDCFTILAQCNNNYYYDLLILEALYIKTLCPEINRQAHTESHMLRLPL